MGGVQCYLKKVSGIVIGYCIATVIYLIIETSYFDFRKYMECLINFNISGPMYFVLLYLQLMLAFRPLIIAFEKTSDNILNEIYLFVAVIFLAIVTTQWTNVLDVYGGGGRILSGTYLLLYYIGMLIEKHKLLQKVSIKKSVMFMLIFGGIWFAWWRYQCSNQLALEGKIRFIFGEGFNPPGLTLMLAAIFMLFFSFGIFTLIEKNYLGKLFVKLISLCGRHSMYIFLYHRLILDYFLLRYFPIGNVWIKRITFFSSMIVCPILIENIIKKLIDIWRRLNAPIDSAM